MSGLAKALEKRPGLDKLERIVDKIEAKLRAKGLREISSESLGKWVLLELKRLDAVAYLRFASVYHQFENPRDFTKEVRQLI